MRDDLYLDISELFHSLQGESTYAGYPCVFIRLTGCNLRCVYCDAKYTYEEEGGQKSITEILDFIAAYPAALVEITGGEPLLQENVYPLMEGLLEKGRKVLLETNGSISLAKVPKDIIKIMDIKCPDSGMDGHLHRDNLHNLGKDDEIKFVISSRRDYDWAKALIKEEQLAKYKNLLFSAVAGKLSPQELADWLLADQLAVRLQVQLHKVLWPEVLRGA